MIPLKKLSVIIPAFNEENTIRAIISRIELLPINKEIVAVDDGSRDRTGLLLDDLKMSFDQNKTQSSVVSFKVIHHQKNFGKGAAVQSALAHVTGDVVIIQDADLEYDPSEYPRLIEPIQSGDADVVFGTRFLGNRRRVHLFWHALGNNFLTFVSNLLTNLNITDVGVGYKAFKANILKSVPLRSKGFGIEVELAAKMAKLRARIYEVPVSYRGRNYADGKKTTLWTGFVILGTIFKFWLIDDLYLTQPGLRTLRIMEGAGRYNEWLFKRCAPFIGNKVLETGAGVGNITKYLLSSQKIVATDINPDYLDEIKQTFSSFPNVTVKKLDVEKKSEFERLSEEKPIDTVICLNVLEHVRDDDQALANIHNFLNPGGRLIIVVPAHQALFSSLDKYLHHERRYSLSSLRGKMVEAGFKIITGRYLNMLGAMGWFLNGHVLRRKMIPPQQVRLMDFFLPLLKSEGYIRPPFGLSVFMVGEK